MEHTAMMQFQRGPSYASTAMLCNAIDSAAYAHACDIADREVTPVGIWYRDGWHAVSDIAPDIDESDTRESDGWQLVAILDPDNGDRS